MKVAVCDTEMPASSMQRVLTLLPPGRADWPALCNPGPASTASMSRLPFNTAVILRIEAAGPVYASRLQK